jgi:hypothetical protein
VPEAKLENKPATAQDNMNEQQPTQQPTQPPVVKQQAVPVMTMLEVAPRMTNDSTTDFAPQEITHAYSSPNQQLAVNPVMYGGYEEISPVASALASPAALQVTLPAASPAASPLGSPAAVQMASPVASPGAVGRSTSGRDGSPNDQFINDQIPLVQKESSEPALFTKYAVSARSCMRMHAWMGYFRKSVPLLPKNGLTGCSRSNCQPFQ